MLMNAGPFAAESTLHGMTVIAVTIVDSVVDLSGATVAGAAAAVTATAATRGKTRGYQVQMPEAGFLRSPEEGHRVVGYFEELQHIVHIHPAAGGFRDDDLHGTRRAIQWEFPVVVGRTRFHGGCGSAVAPARRRGRG